MRTYFVSIFVGLAAALVGCSRSVPASYPLASAASLDAPEARPVHLGRPLTEEPPLPGEQREGWEALERGDASGGGHDHHGHHGHHGGAHDHRGHTAPPPGPSGEPVPAPSDAPSRDAHGGHRHAH